MSINFEPIAGTKNRVVIEPIPVEEKTASGLYIPDTAKDKPVSGKVISITEHDEDDKEPVLNEGDIVLHAKYAGTEIVSGGKTYLLMKESDILIRFKQ